ncbi:hypothetical protein FISHEDRAFT_69994 [Fistulina hepatica ATCC 64428]|uniref:Uncharacterized protein n=1 Tax=Fistulina hepatica ATCC 64428 TaxID=1128425 RepID=A0A0D7ALY4_9AGAR|nr:hypothetical protein FISHEDRAFT_69994 [Fistulina hepatica ATCC 64428]
MNTFDFRGFVDAGFEWLFLQRVSFSCRFCASSLWLRGFNFRFPRIYTSVTAKRLAAAQSVALPYPTPYPGGVRPSDGNTRGVALSRTYDLPIPCATYGPGVTMEMPVPLERASTRLSTLERLVPEANNAPDWFLHLSHVHRTNAMRAHRWIYALCEVKRAFDQHRIPDVQVEDMSPGEIKFLTELEERNFVAEFGI